MDRKVLGTCAARKASHNSSRLTSSKVAIMGNTMTSVLTIPTHTILNKLNPNYPIKYQELVSYKASSPIYFVRSDTGKHILISVIVTASWWIKLKKKYLIKQILFFKSYVYRICNMQKGTVVCFFLGSWEHVIVIKGLRSRYFSVNSKSYNYI